MYSCQKEELEPLFEEGAPTFKDMIIETNGNTTIGESGLSDTILIKMCEKPCEWMSVSVSINEVSQLYKVVNYSDHCPLFWDPDEDSFEVTWEQPRLVILHARDDLLPEGNHEATITFYVACGEDKTKGEVSIKVKILDND